MAIKGLYFTISEASKELGVSRQTISRWIKQGRLTAETVGREKLISKRQVEHMRRLDAASLAKRIIAKVTDFIKQTYYSEGDEVSVEDSEFVLTKVNGTREKIEIPVTIIIGDKEHPAVIEMPDQYVIEKIPKPHKKGGKRTKE